ncbi:MAG: hypothetical protein U0835_23275 [Isosphaeraceae bacterium]
MEVKCRVCGTINHFEEGACAGGCGNVLMKQTVVLSSSATGSKRKNSISSKFGRKLLASLAGEEAVYASEPQFELIKDTAEGRWLIRHVPTAKNPTYYDGRAVGVDPVPVKAGGQISIGPDRMKLNVSFES